MSLAFLRLVLRPLLPALLLTSLVPQTAAHQPQHPAIVAITDVSVLPMTQATVLRHQTLVLAQGRIREMGPVGKVRVPAGAHVIDGRGCYLLPGLVDMHAHLPGPEGTRHPLAAYFKMQLASGVTGLRSMRGDTSHLRWRDSLRRSGALAPHLYLGAPVFTRDKQYTARKGRQLLHRYQASGYDFIKYLGGLSAAQYDSLLADAHQLGLRVAGHAPRSGLRGAVAARMASIEHIEAFADAYQQDSVQLRELARQMAAQHLFTCPDVYWYIINGLHRSPEQLAQLPGLPYVAAPVRASWQAWQAAKSQQLRPGGVPSPADAQQASQLLAYRRAFRVLHAAGVPFLVSPGDGPYIVPGFGMAEELGLLVEMGLSPYEALRAATYHAAAWLGRQQAQGTVAPGQAADLLLLGANPLDNIANVRRVRGVALGGRWLTPAQLLPSQP